MARIKSDGNAYVNTFRLGYWNIALFFWKLIEMKDMNIFLMKYVFIYRMRWNGVVYFLVLCVHLVFTGKSLSFILWKAFWDILFLCWVFWESLIGFLSLFDELLGSKFWRIENLFKILQFLYLKFPNIFIKKFKSSFKKFFEQNMSAETQQNLCSKQSGFD